MFIPLTQGQVAIVDKEDFELLNQWIWTAAFNPHTSTFYAVRGLSKTESGKRKLIHMGRVILGALPGQIVDHRNRDTLDNRRRNLRIVTARQNSLNTRLLLAHNTSGFRGVSWHRGRRKWRAYISVKDQVIHLGLFDNPQEAARAYDAAALHFNNPEFAQLNF